MNRIRASLLLLCALGAGPSLCFALTHDAAPSGRGEPLLEPLHWGYVPTGDVAAPPLRLYTTPPPELAAESPGLQDQPQPLPLEDAVPLRLVTGESLFADGAWIDSRLFQAVIPQDRVVKIRKWWAKQPNAKVKRVTTVKARQK